MKVHNPSAMHPNSEISEQKVLEMFFFKERFQEKWKKANFSSAILCSGSFTIYKYNFLQLAVFFRHVEAVETIYKNFEAFQHLLKSSELSSDSIAYLSMLRPSITLLRFFFDKVEFVNPIAKRAGDEDSCVFWHIHSKEFVLSLWNFLQELPNSSDFSPELQRENFRRLAEFFDQIQRQEIPSGHPLKTYFEKTDFSPFKSSSRSLPNDKSQSYTFVRDQFGFSTKNSKKENRIGG